MNGVCESNKRLSAFPIILKKGWCIKVIMKYLECKKCCNAVIHVACIRTEGGGLALSSNCP